MKKSRLFTTLFASILSLSALAGCTTPASEGDVKAAISSIIPNPESIQKEGLNIKSVTFENVPAQIPVGSFDTFGIQLKIVYSDDSVETYPLVFENLPDNIKIALNTVGSHDVKIFFRGEETTHTFNITQGDARFLVRYFSYDGHIIQREEIIPGNAVVHSAPSADKMVRPADSLYKYSFYKWDDNVSHVSPGEIIGQSYDIYPEYTITQKRYDASKKVVPTIEDEHLRLLKYNKSQYQFDAYIYVGRIDRVPLLYSEKANKDSVTPPYEGELYFDVSTKEQKEEAALSVIHEIRDQALNVDTSHFTDLFKDSTHKPANPEYLNYNLVLTDLNDYILFDGDTSYTPMYNDSIFSFVESNTEDNKTSFSVNPASDLIAGNQYYRVAYETSVDIVIDMVVNTIGNEYQIMNFNYYFLINKNNTYQVTEYTDISGEFNSTGTKLSYNMYDLRHIVDQIVGA